MKYVVCIIKIQRWFRGCLVRLKRLPLILYKMQFHLKNEMKLFNFSKISKDGRTNSCIDEDNIIDKLLLKFKSKIDIPKIRMWYDILVYDELYGWLPVNIKISTLKTADNIGNLSTCVYAYTDTELNFDKQYNNGKLSIILSDALESKKYTKKSKKDHYFLVVNKLDSTDIIINSIKGLKTLTSNTNNLPFQVCWSKNREYTYSAIHLKVKQFIECLQSAKPSWKVDFMHKMNRLKLN